MQVYGGLNKKKSIDNSRSYSLDQDDFEGYYMVINKRGKLKPRRNMETLDYMLNSIVDEIYEQIQQYNCMILNASTGLGKSTTLIHKIYERFTSHKIVCSQVTVINTTSLCKYVASTYPGMQLGVNIGYQAAISKILPTTFHSIIYQTTRVTTLRFLIEIQKGTLLNPQNYIIVIDEAHTNDVNSQEQLAVIRDLLMTKPKEQLPFFIIQSASIDPKEYADYFNLDGYIMATGSKFPIIKLFLEDFGLQNATDFQSTTVQIVENIIKSAYLSPKLTNTPISKAMVKLDIINASSILIFITKQKQMSDLERRLKASRVVQDSKMQIITISAPAVERDNQLITRNDNDQPKIFISTNVIETGYTIDNLSFVIDCMKYKQHYRNPISKIEVVKDIPIDQQMQQQRRGRVGRTRPGIYIGICPQKTQLNLFLNKELQIQITNIQTTIAQFGIERFIELKFMKPVPFEHCMDFLQIQALFGAEQLNNPSYNIIQNMIFSGIYFKDVRQVLLILLGMNQGIRLLDLIIIMSVVMHPGKFKPDRSKEVDDFSQMLKQVYSGSLVSPEISTQNNQFIGFFKLHNYNIYAGQPLDNPKIMERFINCVALVYYFFMFQRKSGNKFESKQGLKIEIELPASVKYFVAMNVELQEQYTCKNIIKITEKQWKMIPCK